MAGSDFRVTIEVIKKIGDITTTHTKALNEDITDAFPDQPDMAYTLAMGFALSVLLTALTPKARLNAADGINLLALKAGFALTPI